MTMREDDCDFVQFGGSLRSTRTVDDALVASTLRRMRRSATSAVPDTAPNPIRPAQMPAPADVPYLPHRRFHHLRASMATLATLVLISATAMWFGREPTSDRLLFQDVSQGDVVSNLWGNQGGTMVFGQRNPVADQFESIGSLLESAGTEDQQIVGAPMVIGDTLIALTVNGMRSELVSHDLIKGSRRWSTAINLWASLNSDGKSIFGVAALTQDGTPVVDLSDGDHLGVVAISLETGAIRWIGPVRSPSSILAFGVTVSDRHVLTIGTHGEVTALDTESGREQWTYTPSERKTLAPTFSYGVLLPRFLTANATHVFAVEAGNSIHQLDLTTGKLVAKVHLTALAGTPRVSTFLQSSDDRLVVTAIGQKAEDTSSPRGEDFYPAWTFVIEIDTMTITHVVEAINVSQPPAWLDDTMYLCTQKTGGGFHDLWKVDLASGQVTRDLGNLLSVSPLTLMISGSTLIARGDAASVSLIDMRSGQVAGRPMMGIPGTYNVSPTDGVALWGSRILLVTFDGGIYASTAA